MRYTDAEKRAILTEARATVAATHAKMQRWKAEQQQREGANRFVTKDRVNARVPTVHRGGDSMPSHAVSEHTQYTLERDRWEADLERSRQHPREERERQRAQQVVSAPDADADGKFVIATGEDCFGHIDMRIEQSRDVITEAVGEVIGSERGDFQRALARSDAEIQTLKREVASLRSEVDLKLKLKGELAAARAEVEELRQRAPSFKAELASLREKAEKQAKLITRLRGQASVLEHGQSQLEKQQTHQRLEMTSIEVSSVGSATRAVFQRLRDSGVEFDDWAPSGLAS
jgi:hypothetical protein